MENDELVESVWFKETQTKLAQVFSKEGYNEHQSEELGFFIAQAIRDVPRLLRLLEEVDQHSTDELMDAIHMILSNRLALEEATRLLNNTT